MTCDRCKCGSVRGKEKMNTLRNAVTRLLIQGWTEREIILEIRKITARYALDKFK